MKLLADNQHQMRCGRNKIMMRMLKKDPWNLLSLYFLQNPDENVQKLETIIMIIIRVFIR